MTADKEVVRLTLSLLSELNECLEQLAILAIRLKQRFCAKLLTYTT